MARLPVGFRNNIKVVTQKEGLERREEIFNNITDKDSYLPKGINIKDMDTSFIQFVENQLKLIVNGASVPVFFFTIQKWTEFTNTWETSDEFKNMKIPFITILRKPDIQDGTNQAGLWNIPGKNTYTYMKVPTWDGIRKGIDLYKIPQPTSVDLEYEVRLFANKLNDLNSFTAIVKKEFQSRQSYLNVKGHPLPVVSEGTSDESIVNDMEHRKYYAVNFSFKLLGYLLDENDFKIVPTINRITSVFEIVEDFNILPSMNFTINDGTTITYDFTFKPKSNPQITFGSKYHMNLTSIQNISNISGIEINLNGASVFTGLSISTPIEVQNNDQITINVVKDSATTGKFQLIGKLWQI